ncbi:hypothetical protein VHEMI09061 [[Torrubiella] hemipterigena]|uniref:Alpha/beta hydrolase fold-3 domain-containing protein n=1 Tax=[Torrubiella] hemipterigena TaxID=1531966 RepID=A0A0A1TQT8_9HYPO|nr:hypothetical protein VHEMI09061 [[Torrubiella] hemipterigena]
MLCHYSQLNYNLSHPIPSVPAEATLNKKMPSLTAFLFKQGLRRTAHPNFASSDSFDAAVKENRATCSHEPPPDVRSSVNIEQAHVGTSIVYTVKPATDNAAPFQMRIMYIHGGAFVFEIDELHWRLIATLCQRLNASITVPIYPLAPEHHVTDMYGMLEPIYSDMASSYSSFPSSASDSSSPPTPFYVAGDSAGGGLALGLTQQALLEQRPVAKGMVLICPSVDTTLANPDVHVKTKTDPYLDMPGLAHALNMAMGTMDRRNHLVSPTFGPIFGLPPMLVFIAEEDILGPDDEIFVQKAIDEGCQVELFRGPGMWHVWVAMPIPEAKPAMDKIVSWLQCNSQVHLTEWK